MAIYGSDAGPSAAGDTRGLRAIFTIGHRNHKGQMDEFDKLVVSSERERVV